MKNALKFLPLFATSILGCPVLAAPIEAQAVNTAMIDDIATGASAERVKEADPRIVRLQIMLDRVGASPGVIDGYIGRNVSKAIAGFEASQGLPIDGKLDPEVVRRLMDDIPAIQAYAITVDDAGDVVEKIPKDYAEQAKMEHLGYTSIAEKLAERFHMDISLLKALNPTSTFTPSETIAVAIPGPAKSGVVKSIEVRKRTGEVFAFAADGSLLAVYPATIGSKDSPSPTGIHKVQGVSRMPTYTYNPKVNFQQGDNNKVLKLPAGPNGPVGTVWIDLTEPTYGIHGTPEPELIDKVGSHGCERWLGLSEQFRVFC